MKMVIIILIWIIFGHVIGVYSNYTILAGIAIHFLTALFIGIVLGIFLIQNRNIGNK